MNIQHDSLCWFCVNTNCQWIRKLKPYPDNEWVADATDTEGGSYNVYECSHFEHGKRSIQNAYPKQIVERVVPSLVAPVCPTCGQYVQRVDRFCRRCGQSIYWKGDKKGGKK